MEIGNNKIYDAQFRGNILVVGKTERHVFYKNLL